MLKSVNPYDGKEIKSYQENTVHEMNLIVEEAHEAFLKWRETGFSFRKERMKAAASVLRNNKEKYAAIMTEEMGKPISQAIAEVEKCAWVCDYYADGAETFLKDEKIKTEASKSYVTYNPLGVILAVMPWNFPFWQVFRFAAPNLMAGNVGVLKHSSNVTGCALAIEEVFRLAEFPQNLFRSIVIRSGKMGSVINNPLVKGITLTGSTPAGKAVAASAGKALKKTVLELGGSDPYIILEDADVKKAAQICASARLLNGGQSCIAAKRFIVPEKIHDSFVKYFVKECKSKEMGDPKKTKTEIGPQARFELRDELHQQVLKSENAGAKIVLGGSIPRGSGAFYPPTVLINVKKGMPAYDEELFGPVAAIIKVKDVDEAVKVANDSSFGLGAAVFTDDLAKGEQIAKYRLEAGCCFVNDFVKSDPRLPFGGIKESGYGRELSPFGIKEFVNIKTVVVK